MEQSKYTFSAACYCRLSKDDETDGTSVSIETQQQILSEFCKENHLKIFDFYCDDDLTLRNILNFLTHKIIQSILPTNL